MKRVLSPLFLLICSWLSAQNNILLSNDYWKTKPTPEQVKQKIAEGNDPIALNERAYDATSLAINNGAPNETIMYLLSLEGNEISKPTHDKRTYLFWAVFSNNLPITKYLLDKGADVNIKDSHFYTPILFAAIRGNTNQELYDLLLKHGANIKETNEDGANALLLIIPHLKDLKEAQYFTKKGLSLQSVDKNGNNAIFYAARNGNKEIIKQLVAKKINAKAINHKGQNLMFAAAEGARMKTNELDFFKYVESLGINPNQKDKNGLTPLFISSARNKDASVIQYFIDKGNDVNQSDKEGNTPLMEASSRNALEVVSLLAEKTNNINAKNKQGESALTLAVNRNSPEVVSFLIKKGADIKVKSTDGNTLVYYLVDSFNPREVKNFDEKWAILAQNGLDFTQNQSKNNNLYHLAVEKANLDILQKTTSISGININAKNEEGLTPLHKAVMTGKNLDIIQFLLKNGADKTITTEFGESVYELAQENEALKTLDINFLK
ncbi:MAG: ankyrin repeat domain-containing protein [Capnocytophaga sp.]|nr:ankyrin repeat domain-containing protein [Capnocytophaga sp.]